MKVTKLIFILNIMFLFMKLICFMLQFARAKSIIETKEIIVTSDVVK